MLPQEDDHPNLVQMSEVSSPTEGSANSTKKSKGHLQLQQSPASYEMNRCTIIIEHGDPYVGLRTILSCAQRWCVGRQQLKSREESEVSWSQVICRMKLAMQ